MRRVQTKQTLTLRLLAFVMALALLWYSLNPAPRPMVRKKKEAEPPEEKKRNAESHSMPTIRAPLAFKPSIEDEETLSLPDNDDDDDFEWPEFIDG